MKYAYKEGGQKSGNILSKIPWGRYCIFPKIRPGFIFLGLQNKYQGLFLGKHGTGDSEELSPPVKVLHPPLLTQSWR